MNVELAQTIALIAYGNEYLSSGGMEPRELFPAHSTFQFVSSVTFQRSKGPNQVLGKPGTRALSDLDYFFIISACPSSIPLNFDGTRDERC